ncbi:hypothetical protein PFMC_04563 [Plasmodium falciparum CAMP/Malaysia]|uniref:Uncharacterized protein n=1 Tax=Plasmodium falciparum (isolate Camp / Malaysia) TaxID=5835 RepID=A0A024X202_PLAFC|nr:hypothetical protein PFMC_04563 [Plasmodium falciparum CAMP/Malaysia]
MNKMEIKISNKLVEQIGDIFSKQLGEQFVDINLQFCLNYRNDIHLRYIKK